MKTYKTTIGKYAVLSRGDSTWKEWNPIRRLSKTFSSLAKAKEYAKAQLEGNPDRTAWCKEQSA